MDQVRLIMLILYSKCYYYMSSSQKAPTSSASRLLLRAVRRSVPREAYRSVLAFLSTNLSPGTEAPPPPHLRSPCLAP